MIKEQKELLEQQLEWTKSQIAILDGMDSKLHEMKKIAEHAAGNDLSLEEREACNYQLKIVQNEYALVEAMRHQEFS